MDTNQTAAYCRTAVANELAMRTQERQIREYAKKRGYGELTFYRDCGQNVATLDRPAMNALTADIKAGKIGAVITAYIARITRGYALFSEWIDLLTEYGVTFLTPADGEFAVNYEISYILRGDYYLPNLKLNDPPDAPPLGRYGMMHKAFLKEHKPALYSQLLLPERLYPLCRAADEAAAARLAAIGDPEIAREVIHAEVVCK
ncbi:MAG: TnpV protein [Clostridiales bacterium]|jgi:hypothetical protein|nr:TnpV protein [Clostridiales bacterium]